MTTRSGGAPLQMSDFQIVVVPDDALPIQNDWMAIVSSGELVFAVKERAMAEPHALADDFNAVRHRGLRSSSAA